MAGKVPRRAAQPARHRRRPAHLQGLSRPARSARWQRAGNIGARPQRLLWASTGTKDPKASDILYVKALASPLHGQHDAGGHAEGLGRHGEVGRDAAGRRRRLPRRCWRASPRPASTSTRWPQQLQDEGADVVRQVLERPDGAHRVQDGRRSCARRADHDVSPPTSGLTRPQDRKERSMKVRILAQAAGLAGAQRSTRRRSRQLHLRAALRRRIRSAASA